MIFCWSIWLFLCLHGAAFNILILYYDLKSAIVILLLVSISQVFSFHYYTVLLLLLPCEIWGHFFNLCEELFWKFYTFMGIALNLCIVFDNILVFLLLYHKTLWPKAAWEQMVYFTLQVSGHMPLLREIRAGIEGRNLEKGTIADALKECCLLIHLLSLLSYATQDHMPRGVTYLKGLDILILS